jgi:CheY-like chemotaxis protein
MTETRSAMLRAEILRGGDSEVTCALEMTDRSVFIVTERLPPIGESVHLRLSFPRMVRPLLVGGRVTQVRMSTGQGQPAGFVAEFEVESDDEQTKLGDLARRLRRDGRGRDAGSTPPNSRPLYVLLVEDNQLIRDMFKYAVEKYFKHRAGRVELIEASTVGAAWTALETRNIVDIALVDHFLPDDTGAALVSRLRAEGNHARGRVPIVAMSVGGADVRRTMLDAGADLFLQKPIVLKDLFCTLEFLMDSTVAAPPIGSDRGAA